MILEDTKKLHAAHLFEVVKVGRKWKFKTPHGVETFGTKKRAIRFADEWSEVYELIRREHDNFNTSIR